jgi:hypothetical protein
MGVIIKLVPFIMSIAPIVALYWSRNNIFWQRTIINGMRFFLGMLLMGAGLARYTFGLGMIGPVWLHDKLAEYGLGLYGHFISLSEIVVGFLLISNRFATLGAIMSTSIFANILAITISQNWAGTPYLVAWFLIWNITLLVYDWHKLKFILTDDVSSLKNTPIERSNLALDKTYLAILFVFLIAVGISSFNPSFSKGLSIAAYLSLFVLWVVQRIKPEWLNKK